MLPDAVPLDLALSIVRPRLSNEWLRDGLLVASWVWSHQSQKRRFLSLKTELTQPTTMFPLEKKVVAGYRFKQRTFYLTQHLGTDYAAKTGDVLRAPFDGTVVKAFNDPLAGGLTIWYQSASGQRMRFMHLSSFTVPSGRVSQGQEIGRTGNTGALTTGAHLHLDLPSTFEGFFWKNIENFRDPELFDWTPASTTSLINLFQTDLSPSQKPSAEAERVQRWLVQQGFMQGLPANEWGYYGKKTQAAVDKFQKSSGIMRASEFGWWYPATRKAANSKL